MTQVSTQKEYSGTRMSVESDWTFMNWVMEYKFKVWARTERARFDSQHMNKLWHWLRGMIMLSCKPRNERTDFKNPHGDFRPRARQSRSVHGMWAEFNNVIEYESEWGTSERQLLIGVWQQHRVCVCLQLSYHLWPMCFPNVDLCLVLSFNVIATGRYLRVLFSNLRQPLLSIVSTRSLAITP